MATGEESTIDEYWWRGLSLDEIQANPEAMAAVKAKIQENQRIAELNLIEMAPMLARLRELGYHLESIAPLSDYERYDDALPILLEVLAETQNEDIKADIIGVLGVPWVNEDVVRLIANHLRHPSSPQVAWKASGALAGAITSDTAWVAVEFLETPPSHPEANLVPLICEVRRLRFGGAARALVGLLDSAEPEVAEESARAIKAIGDPIGLEALRKHRKRTRATESDRQTPG